MELKKITVQENKYSLIPKFILEIDNISNEAILLYLRLYTETISIKDLPSVDINILNELIQNNLVSVSATNILTVKSSKPNSLVDNSKTNSSKPLDTITVKKKPSLIDIISERSKKAANGNDELYKKLMEYFNLRLSPPIDSRFYNSGTFNTYSVNVLLSQLNNCNTDKVKVVQQSIDGQYFKFFDIPKSSADSADSGNNMSMEEFNSLLSSGEYY